MKKKPGHVGSFVAVLLLSSAANAQTFANGQHHAQRANTPAGRAQNAREISSSLIAGDQSSSGGHHHDKDKDSKHTRAVGLVSYQGGPVVVSAQLHDVYLNASDSSAWGHPDAFLADLGKSDFIHLVDQYVAATDDNRYTVGASAFINYTPLGPVLTDFDMEYVAFQAASTSGLAGYGHIYNIFLPPGTDVCFANPDGSASSNCYSPDNPSTFRFCGFHGSFDVQDDTGGVVAHLLYTVEPFENVPGCQVASDTPNGQLDDSTDSVLSHETFEIITDPDFNGWWDTTTLDLYGYEIADQCQFVNATGGFDNPVFDINYKDYAVQYEYSNAQRACSSSPKQDCD